MNKLEINQQFIFLRDEIIRRNFSNLNEEQLTAVLSNNNAVITAACPGSGKTQVIVNRIIYLTVYGNIYNTDIVPKNLREEHINELNKYLNNKESSLPDCLSEKSVEISKIAVITFTSMAAVNMEERYKKITGRETVPFFGTIHSLFYKLISDLYPNLSIISQSQVIEIIKSVLCDYVDSLKELQIKCVLNEISKYKNSMLFNIEPELKVDKKIFKECFNAYENYMCVNNLMDFDDIIIKCIKAFEWNRRTLEKYAKKYSHILVDEFQDCDSSQVRILQHLTEGGNIFAVGDEDQCIYGFRGSRPDCMVEFDKYFYGGVKYFLSKNYRSTTSIIEAARRVISNNKLRNSKEMLGVKKEFGKVNVLISTTETEQAENISAIILNMEKFEWSETAVLYRTNNEAQNIISNLIKNKIKFELTDKSYNFFNMEICKDIAAYFRLSLNPTCRDSFIRVINKPCRYVSKTIIGKISNNAFSRNWFNFIMDIPGVKISQLKSIKKFEKNVRKIKSMTPFKAIEYILDKIGYKGCVKEYQREILNQFIEISSGFKTLAEFLNFIDEYNKEVSSSGEGIVLSTIHGAKGLEYKSVFIINCNNDNMPHSNSSGNLEEERRLFYVGITRAKEALWLSYSEIFKGNNSSISPFILESLKN
ncbi:MAG: ATP-dependent helicase [Solirubrobacterales bacterium]